VFVDFETAVERKRGYTLERMSVRQYVDDPRFDVLSVGVAVGTDDVLVFQKYGRDGGRIGDARRFLAEQAAAGKWLVAHNVDFDGLVLARAWKIWFSHFFDTMAVLRFLGLGASLANAGHLVGVKKEEAPDFTEESLLEPTTAAKFLRYNAIDVHIARLLFLFALDDQRMSDLEFWAVDVTCRENLRGIGVDRDHAAGLARRYAERRDASLAELASRFPAFDTSARNSPQKALGFLKAAFAVELGSIDRRDPEVAALRDSSTDAGAFLRLLDQARTWERQSKKVGVIAGGPARVFGQLHYYGAHTGRWTGGGRNSEKLNLHNLPKGGKGDFSDLALIRGAVVADEDESWVSSDLSTIEPRVTAFLAKEESLLERFASNEDVYIWFGSDVFPGVPIVKGGRNDELRQMCKAGVIGLGFGMGEERFYERLLSTSPNAPRQQAHEIFIKHRAKFTRVHQLRWDYFRAFRNAVLGAPSTVGKCTFKSVMGVGDSGPMVEIVLPTGRSLFYRSIQVRTEVNRFGETEKVYRYAESYFFDASKRERGSAGRAKLVKCADGRLRAQVLPQTLVENIVQAIARDLLVAQMREIELHGLRVRFSVHDEGVFGTAKCTCPRRDDPRPKGESVESAHEAECPWVAGRAVIERMMSTVPPCFPALAGLPVACELSDSIRSAYGK
jgi:DNA polymerase